MKVKVKLYGRYRDIIGKNELEITVDNETSENIKKFNTYTENKTYIFEYKELSHYTNKTNDANDKQENKSWEDHP